MNPINFLPESFVRQHRRQHRRPAEFAVIAATALILLALWLTMAGPDAGLAQQAEHIDQQIQRIEQQQSEQQRLTQERSRLTSQLLIARETYQPIRTTEVLARLSELTPSPVRLVKFELIADRPEPQRQAEPAQNDKKVVRGRNEQRADKPREPNRMRINLTGMAPGDDEVVLLIRRLEQDPVFSSVVLRNSRMIQTKTHIAREFQLELEIDLDRRFVPTDERGGAGHAH